MDASESKRFKIKNAYEAYRSINWNKDYANIQTYAQKISNNHFIKNIVEPQKDLQYP